MKIKRTLSILLVTVMLLSLFSMTAGAASIRVNELVGHVEIEAEFDGLDIDIEFRNDDIFDETELIYLNTRVTEVGGSKHYTNLYNLILLPENGVDLSGLTLHNTRIEGAVVTDLAPLGKRGGITVSLEVVLTDHGLPFKDVGKQDWYFDAVKYVYEHQLMNGTGTHDFDPKASTTREQMVTVLWRMHGSPKSAGKLPFTDVKKSAYSKEAILWASEKGIVKGVSRTAFAPRASITREQLVTLFYRYTDFIQGNPSGNARTLAKYKDADRISAYARDAMAWAVETELITGMGSSTLQPRGTATRAQIATILMRYHQANRYL